MLFGKKKEKNKVNNETLSDVDVIRKFDKEVWENLSEQEKKNTIDQLIEVVKKKFGIEFIVEPVYVNNLPSNTIGECEQATTTNQKHKIFLNYDRIIEGRIYSSDRIGRMPDSKYNMTVLATIIHELRHAKQNENYVNLQLNPSLFTEQETLQIKTIRWNMKSAFNYPDSSFGCAYFSLDNNYSKNKIKKALYYLQPTEFDAITNTSIILNNFYSILDLSSDSNLMNNIKDKIKSITMEIKKTEIDFINKCNIENPQKEVELCIQKHIGKIDVETNKKFEELYIEKTKEEFLIQIQIQKQTQNINQQQIKNKKTFLQKKGNIK